MTDQPATDRPTGVEPRPPGARRIERHPIDLVSLLTGLFLVIGTGVWVVWERGAMTTMQLVVLAPIALIIVGAAGVAATLLGPRRP